MPGGLRGWGCAALASGVLACAPGAAPEPVRVLDLERRIDAHLEQTQALEARLPSPSEVPEAHPQSRWARQYASVAIRFEPLPRGSRVAVRRMAVQSLERAGAHSLVLRTDRGERAYPAGGPFPGVPVPVLYGVSGAAQASLAGSELDLVVPLDSGRTWRVTVWNEPDGRVLASGIADTAPTPAAADAGGPVYIPASDDGWSADERVSLRRALALLTPAERDAIGELRFERHARAAVAVEGHHACGDFLFRDLERAIRVYDCAFENDARHFVGPLERPERPSTLAILHELGHALALAQTAAIAAEAFAQRERIEVAERELRRLGRRVRGAERQRVERMYARMAVLSQRYDHLGRRLQREAALPAPVAAFARVPGAASGITPYGRTAPMEAFAEAFALHRADRPALLRVAPDVVSFFDDARHLVAAGAADAPPGGAALGARGASGRELRATGVCAGPDAPVW